MIFSSERLKNQKKYRKTNVFQQTTTKNQKNHRKNQKNQQNQNQTTKITKKTLEITKKTKKKQKKLNYGGLAVSLVWPGSP